MADDIVLAIERLSAAEFADILERSSLAERRPMHRPDILKAMVNNASLFVTARTADGRLVGAARSITDFAYCCYLSELCVDRACQRQGIGRKLIERTRQSLPSSCVLLLMAAPAAKDYYAHVGFEKADTAWMLPRTPIA